ncbi:large conductance mechanosensitive channel protein MscL [Micromonospora fiedleri]|uniref:Large-conductance mechanosensitive channel n=1 Tax=Micromonospora fiedleri TaxID=1157498 RepID=A0ABS1UNC0_9ACTN|nr:MULTISPECIES: large conductance mechanosensitive channel protein MscL [Micromonospora]MBL6276846.1 large conductance mechanosensitive channel protein MscL [Micromonospora fiedleri]WSK43449.1 large conductance mechanosensitive channel protein MscL [Micromonospora maris]
MLKGFKDFIMRGNVVDLAVGVVIGAAFTGLVTAFTSSFLQPVINLIGKGPASEGAQFELGENNPVTWGVFVNALITFLLTAAALYFLVVFPMNKLAERRKRGEEPPPAAPSEEVKLLTEIRDALVAAGRTTPAQQRSALDDVLGSREEPPTGR